jgi:hypothetical protein
MREIKVPKVPASAFDKNRRPSDLIWRQVEHLQHVAARHPDGAALAADAKRIRTEGQAAAFIGRVTEWLHAAGTPRPAPMAQAPQKHRRAGSGPQRAARRRRAR